MRGRVALFALSAGALLAVAGAVPFLAPGVLSAFEGEVPVAGDSFGDVLVDGAVPVDGVPVDGVVVVVGGVFSLVVGVWL